MMIFDVDEDLLSESRDAMLNEAIERCCQEMIARGEYASHPNFVLPKHEGPNATEMMANDIVKLYLYASKQIDDFPNLNPPSSVTENVNQDRINVGPLPIEKKTNESCDVNKLINSIPVTPTAGASSPDTEPESPVFLKHTVQRENKLKYSPTKSEQGKQQPGLDVHSSDHIANKVHTPTSKNSRSHGSSNKEDEDLKCNCKIYRRLRGLEQKLQETTDKNIKLVKQIRGLRQQSMTQRKENVKLLKGRDSLMTEKIKMRREIDRLEQKFEKTKQNRPNQKEIKVIPIDNDTDDNGNEWETVGAKKTKNRIKTRTEVISYFGSIGSQIKMTKSKKVRENKKLKKQTSHKYPAKKVTQLNKRQPNKSDRNNQNGNKDRHNSSLSSSSPTECSSITSTSSSNNSSSNSSSSSSSSNSSRDKTQSINTINGLSANNNNTNLTRQIPVKSNKKKCVIGDSNMRGLAKQLKPKLDNPDAVCVYKTSGMRIGHLIPRLKGYICEDTDAVVLHLGTNDISGPINKIKEDINKLAEKMEGFKNTHFYVAEIPPRSQKKYNAHIHDINCHIREICVKLFNADYLPTPINKIHLYRSGIHLNEEGQQKLTSAMAEVLNNHSANGQCFPIRTIITRT